MKIILLVYEVCDQLSKLSISKKINWHSTKRHQLFSHHDDEPFSPSLILIQVHAATSPLIIKYSCFGLVSRLVIDLLRVVKILVG